MTPLTWVWAALCALDAAAAPAPRAHIRTARGGQVELRVEVARDAASRARGLMGRRNLPVDAGMVFVFADALPRAFWMRGTLVSLDLACVGEDGAISAILPRAEPLSEAPLTCAAPTRWVLEVNAGTFARLGVVVGDVVRWTAVPGAAPEAPTPAAAAPKAG